MKTNHTPGPWFFVQYANCFCLQREDGYSHTDVLNLEDDDNADKNARLAAAAPTMFEFLQTVAKGQHGELKGEFITNIRSEANEIIKSLGYAVSQGTHSTGEKEVQS